MIRKENTKEKKVRIKVERARPKNSAIESSNEKSAERDSLRMARRRSTLIQFIQQRFMGSTASDIEDRKNDISKSNGKGGNPLLILLLVSVILTWGFAATLVFDLVDYKALIDKGKNIGSEIQEEDIKNAVGALYPFQYEIVRHPIRSLGQGLINIDDYITEALSPRKDPYQLTDSRKPVPSCGVVKRVKRRASWADEVTQEEAVPQKQSSVASSISPVSSLTPSSPTRIYPETKINEVLLESKNDDKTAEVVEETNIKNVSEVSILNMDIDEHPDGVTGDLPGSGNIDDPTDQLGLTKSTPTGSQRAKNRREVSARKPSPVAKAGAYVGALPINPSVRAQVKSTEKIGNVRRGTLEVSIGNFRIINPKAPTQAAEQALSVFRQTLDNHYANTHKHLQYMAPADTDKVSQAHLPSYFAIENIILNKYAVAFKSRRVNDEGILKEGDPDERNILRGHPTAPLEFANRAASPHSDLESDAVSSTYESSQGSSVRRPAVELTSIDKNPILIETDPSPIAEMHEPNKKATLNLSPINRPDALQKSVDLSKELGTMPGEYIKITLENPVRKQPVDEVELIQSKYKALDLGISNFERKQYQVEEVRKSVRRIAVSLMASNRRVNKSPADVSDPVKQKDYQRQEAEKKEIQSTIKTTRRVPNFRKLKRTCPDAQALQFHRRRFVPIEDVDQVPAEQIEKVGDAQAVSSSTEEAKQDEIQQQIAKIRDAKAKQWTEYIKSVKTTFGFYKSDVKEDSSMSAKISEVNRKHGNLTWLSWNYLSEKYSNFTKFLGQLQAAGAASHTKSGDKTRSNKQSQAKSNKFWTQLEKEVKTVSKVTINILVQNDELHEVLFKAFLIFTLLLNLLLFLVWRTIKYIWF